MSASQTRTPASRLAASFAAGSARPAPPLTEEPAVNGELAAARAAAVRETRIKQTVELPESVYEAVQDYARSRRTSFQVVMRALIDDLVTTEDTAHQARLDLLISAAEQDKRDRRRARGRVPGGVPQVP